jgi:two-component system, NtrC family, nitrogen regulation sensor histidine kinase NtrY
VRSRWSRDNRILVGIGAALGGALTGLYALTLKARTLTAAAATDRVLLFVLFYIVVILILVLVFVLARSAVKLVLDARRGVFGSRFRVRVVATHVGLALLPIALLVLPTTSLLQRSVEQWFQPSVAETVRSGQTVADLVRKRSAAVERHAAERVAPRLAAVRDEAARFALLSDAREEARLDLLEWRGDPGGAGTGSTAVSSPRWPVREVNDPTPDWIADARSRGLSRRIDTTSEGGQISRTLYVLPNGILVLGTYEPPEEAVPLRSLSRATSTYRMLEAERASLEAIQILIFLLLAFVVLLAAVWVGLLLARRVTRPIAALAASARRVGAGDFDALVDVEGGDEIGALSGAFNAMTKELRKSRGQLVQANADMAATNLRIDEQRRRVRTILAHLDAGVVAFDDDGFLLAINETARRLLGTANASGTAAAAETEPRRLDELLKDSSLSTLQAFLDRAVSQGGPRETTLSIAHRESTLVLEARVARVPAGAGETASWVVTLEDTTALVKAERAAAWQEAARRMAHEIKNPLTPIRLAAERMRKRARAAADPQLPSVVEEGASTIIEEVGALSDLVDSFGRFARLPAADLQETDLGGVVQQVTKLYAGIKAGVDVACEIPPALPHVRADAEQVKRALINLVDNAVAATPTGGRVLLGVTVDGGRARLSVTDDGPGIPPFDRTRVFDPAYSTKARGTGLGLAITQRIAAEHAGVVRVEENSPHGCRFIFEWPAA